MSTKLIVGLGNYPLEYQDTKHNVGFMVIDQVCRELNLTLNQDKFQGLFTRVKTDKDEIIIAKPQTYMNLSGNFVQAISHFYKIIPQNILIICDDIDLSVGTIRIKTNGSSGGQNGVKDIINKMNTEDIPRIKLGIGRPIHKDATISSHVLSKFSSLEKVKIENSINQATNIVVEYMNGISLTKLMNKYNSNKNSM